MQTLAKALLLDLHQFLKKMNEETVCVSSMIFPRITAVHNSVPQQRKSYITGKSMISMTVCYSG